MIHRFADCEFDEDLFQLRRRGKPVKLEPKTFDVLAHLLRHRDRVVSKNELLDTVWPNQAVSESVLPKCVAALRRAVGDRSGRRRVVQTIHGRGYRFVAAVESVAAKDQSAERQVTEIPPATPPFVGREAALLRLRHGLDAAQAGRGSLLLLAGEPGIGKTRTAEAFAEEASQRGAMVAVGRAYEGEGAPAFWPWIQILRASMTPAQGRRLAKDLGSRATSLGILVPELLPHSPPPPPVTGGDAQQARFRVFDAVAGFLERLAAKTPIVLVLDDLHWADAASLHLLAFLIDTIPKTRLVILGTYRDVEVRRGHPLAEILATLARHASCERIPLRGLQLAETQALVGAICAEPMKVSLVESVQDMTNGNPFFVREMVTWMARERESDAAAEAPLALPQNVRDAIGRRLSGLSPACNAVLRQAAVLGRELNVACLAGMAGTTVEALLAPLEEAVAARVIEQRGGATRFRFHHALIQQTLYDELSTPERVRLHARAAAAMQEICGAAWEPYVDQLAYHFFQASVAGEAAKAVEWSWRAARRAYVLLAYEHSAHHYENALQACELQVPEDATQRCELLLGLGEARQAAGTRDAARAAFAAAAEIARRLGLIDLLARAALGYRGPAEMGAPPEPTTLALLEEAVTLVGSDHPVLRARLLSRLVGTPPYSTSMRQRDALSHEALSLLRQHQDGDAMRDALSARLWACLGPDHIDERRGMARQLLELADRLHDPHTALLAYEADFGACLLRGRLEEADRALAAYRRLAQELRQPLYLFFATFFEGSQALSRGQLDHAERSFRKALELGRGAVPYAHFMYVGQMFNLVSLRGEDDDPELSRIFFGEMMALPYSWEPAMRSALAFALFVRGDRAAAQREFEAVAQQGFDTLRRDEHWLATVGSLARMADVLGDRPRAAELYDLLAPYSDLFIVHDLLRSIHTSVAATLGDLARVLGRHQVGMAYFEDGLAKAEAIDAPLAVLETRLAFARLLFARGKAADRKRGSALVAAAREQMPVLGIKRSWRLAELEAAGVT